MNLYKERYTKQKTQRHRIQISSKGKTIMSEKGERCNEDICKKIATDYYWISLNFLFSN